jgi:hypothetical protein
MNIGKIPNKIAQILFLNALFELFCVIVVLAQNGLMNRPMIKCKFFKSALIVMHFERVQILNPNVIFILFLRKLS